MVRRGRTFVRFTISGGSKFAVDFNVLKVITPCKTHPPPRHTPTTQTLVRTRWLDRELGGSEHMASLHTFGKGMFDVRMSDPICTYIGATIHAHYLITPQKHVIVWRIPALLAFTFYVMCV
jgi:hypothetical protein